MFQKYIFKIEFGTLADGKTLKATTGLLRAAGPNLI
ncbi:hypothetical protein FHW03_001664 [Ochrobactrum sp. RH2CCR150]|nr:hypothetical protein [Ochrobactrum sp. RH2CCR150]